MSDGATVKGANSKQLMAVERTPDMPTRKVGGMTLYKDGPRVFTRKKVGRRRDICSVVNRFNKRGK